MLGINTGRSRMQIKIQSNSLPPIATEMYSTNKPGKMANAFDNSIPKKLIGDLPVRHPYEKFPASALGDQPIALHSAIIDNRTGGQQLNINNGFGQIKIIN